MELLFAPQISPECPQLAIRFLDLPLAAYCEKKMNKAERIAKKQQNKK